ncbi:hypothetical protein EJB05_55386, partial [Eragrostis curvula]
MTVTRRLCACHDREVPLHADKLWGVIQCTHPVVTRSEFLTVLPDVTRRGYVVARMETGDRKSALLRRVSTALQKLITKIPLNGRPFGELQTALDPQEHGGAVAMSSINPLINTLIKIDLVGKEAKKWRKDDAVPSEPIYVTRPGAIDEGDGIVISTVSTVDGDGYALLLDA